jgi:hypothetical protein
MITMITKMNSMPLKKQIVLRFDTHITSMQRVYFRGAEPYPIRFNSVRRIDVSRRFSELTVFDARLYIRVCRLDEPA